MKPFDKNLAKSESNEECILNHIYDQKQKVQRYANVIVKNDDNK